MDPPGQWAAALKEIGLFTMGTTDMELKRALSRQCASFEDVRAALVRRVRETEEAVDREVIKRQEVEEQAKMQKELDAKRIAELEALVESLREEVEGLESKILEMEPMSPGNFDQDDEDEAAKEEEDKDGDSDADSQEDEFGSAGRAEEIEYYREQCVEAEANLEEANKELEKLKQQLNSMQAAAAKQAQQIHSLKGDVHTRDEQIRALQASLSSKGDASQELAQLRAENAHLRELASKNVADKAQHDATERALRQTVEELKNAQKVSPSLQQELQRKDKLIEKLKDDFSAIQIRYNKLQESLNPVHVDPSSEQVKERTASIAKVTARRMQGIYDLDYSVLFDLLYEYEKNVTRLQNEVLSLQTIIKMREQDVGEELSAKFSRERNELLGQITALQMQLSGR
eukprot:TRINITY_DN13624_c0_g1_i1.p1 TRINITY_DN13624_c0_g1~~TRINITY_DN13624_c0_g1_i1.p1  ORF type:complete len:402 (+),score=177.66 TRINITY_DN13624_c0_g1_i1:288-1493(+)